MNVFMLVTQADHCILVSDLKPLLHVITQSYTKRITGLVFNGVITNILFLLHAVVTRKLRSANKYFMQQLYERQNEMSSRVRILIAPLDLFLSPTIAKCENTMMKNSFGRRRPAKSREASSSERESCFTKKTAALERKVSTRSS